MLYSHIQYETMYKVSYALFILSMYHTFFDGDPFSFKMLLLTFAALIASVICEKHYKKALMEHLSETKPSEPQEDKIVSFSMTIEK